MKLNRIIVTGGCGFIGSYFVNRFKKKYPHSRITVIDKLGIGSDMAYLNSTEDLLYWDLCRGMPDLDLHHVDAIFHFAAESHVDRSITGPTPFVKNNIEAMLAVLEYVREHPHTKLINVSTDEVYGALELDDEWEWTEDFPLEPNSPYSASKAACDLLCRSYIKTYGLDIITTRCTNNFGPNQYDEKLIPTVVRSIVNGIPIPVYGAGENIREWLPVYSHVDTIIEIAKNEKRGIYNITGGKQLTNNVLVETIRAICVSNGYHSEIEYVEDRKGHDLKYAVATSYPEYKKTIGKEEFTKYLGETVEHYIRKYESEKAQV
jgi:dTDP-glucose 4,6-dehydratase